MKTEEGLMPTSHVNALLIYPTSPFPFPQTKLWDFFTEDICDYVDCFCRNF